LKITLIALSCSAVLLTSGCGVTRYGAADINSVPEGADIINLKDNTNLGRTPAQIVWRGKGSEKVTVQFQKNGYLSSITSFWVNKRHKTEEAARENATDVHSELEKE